MKNKGALIYLAVLPYFAITTVIAQWGVYYKPSALSQFFNTFLTVYSFLMYLVIGVALAVLHSIPKEVYDTRWARGILAADFVILAAFWVLYYSGLGGTGLSEAMLFFVRVPGFTVVSFLLMGYYLYLFAAGFFKKKEAAAPPEGVEK